MLLLTIGLALFGVWVVGKIFGDQAKAAVVRRRTDEIVRQFGAERVFVSPFDGTLIALVPVRKAIVLGDAKTMEEYPLGGIADVQGLRDGLILIRTARQPGLDAADPPPVADGEPPARIRSLTLRIAIDGAEPHDVTFFDSPGIGAPRNDARLLERARDIEGWYRLVTKAMGDAKA